MGLGVQQRLANGTIYLDTSVMDFMGLIGRISVPSNSAGSFTDNTIIGRPIIWFWYGAAGARRSQVTTSGNTISWDGSGGGGTLIYGVAGGGTDGPIAGNQRRGFQIMKNGKRAIDESLFGWHMIAKGTASGASGEAPFFVPHDPGKPPLIAIAGTVVIGILSITAVSGGSNIKLVGGGGGVVNWYAFAECRTASNFSRIAGCRWWINGQLAGDTSIPSLQIVTANIVYSGGGFSNGNNGGDQVMEIATIPSGRKYAAIISDPGFHFDSSGNGQGNGQTTTKMVAVYTQDNKMYAKGTVYSTTPGGGASPTINAPGRVHVIDVTGFDQF
ncbi:hypothetical protein [Sphingomonas sp. RIT328]|uniref:hypothetical protein n=1 Tax=Sphingomonas sp. RIT328 TaxID=1470591 RepID=UPI00044C8AE7|nr:hypothetical protein [Sphingomonas sp. RIT328]EZP57264.1 hypothetical protein BW41_00107 [Sphingomonas sp. RIT328]